MKNIYLLFLILPLYVFSGCSEDIDQEVGAPEKGKGHIVISTDFSTKATSTTDFSEYVIILDNGQETETFPFPSDGILSNIDPGNYTLTVTSHENPVIPAFDVQVYEGSEEVTVIEGKRTSVPITLKQVNGGVMIEFDSSFEQAGYTNLASRVLSDDYGGLWYTEDKLSLAGYFRPGRVWISIWNEGEPLIIGGFQELPIDLEAGHLWKVTFYPIVAPPNGDLVLSVNFLAENIDTSEIVVSESSESIILDEVEQILYYSHDSQYNSRFMLNLKNSVTIQGTDYTLCIEGYNEPDIPADQFNIQGTYPVREAVGPYIIRKGFSNSLGEIIGTYLIEKAASERYWYATYGNAKFVVEGGITKLIFTAIFTETISGEQQTLRFSYSGQLDWTDSADTSTLPNGSCIATGTPLNTGPASWTSNVLAEVPLLQRWGGEACNVYLELTEGKLYWHSTALFTGTIGVGLVEDPDTGESIFIRGAPIQISGKGMLDFSFTYEGQEAATGVVRVDPTTGDITGVVGDFYYDAFLVQEDLINRVPGSIRSPRKSGAIRFNAVTGEYEIVGRYRMVDYDPQKAR